jgi:radical SAM protein with 4Fe4S-binding SPASM domain
LRCSHCYVSEFYRENKGNDLTLGEICRVLDDLAAMNVRDVTITGGEPILRPDIYQIMDEILARGIRMGSFFTNGLAINDVFIKALVEKPQFTSVYVSLDGLTPETNCVIRGSANSAMANFQKTVATLRCLVKAGVFISVNTALHRQNLPELLDMYQMLKEIGVTQWRLAVPKPLGKYQETQINLQPDWEDVLQAYEQLIDAHLAEVVYRADGFDAPIRLEIELLFRTDMFSRVIKLYQGSDVACFYHRHRCSIKANGDVLPCGYFDNMPVGNVKNQSMRDSWLGDKMQSIKILRIKDMPACADCPVVRFCATGCRALACKQHGNYLAKDDYACAQAIRYYQEILPRLMNKHRLELKTTLSATDFV